MEISLWSVDTQDSNLKDANKIKETIINNSYDGAVVLLHDIHNFSVEGLEMALGELYNRGYQFVTLDTLKQYKDLKTVFRQYMLANFFTQKTIFLMYLLCNCLI